MRFDLSDQEWTVIEPHLPRGGRGPKRVDDPPCFKRYVLYFTNRCAVARPARTLRPSFTIVMPVGHDESFGSQFLMLLPIKTRIVYSLSTVQSSRLTVRQRAQGGNWRRILAAHAAAAQVKFTPLSMKADAHGISS